MKEHVVVVGAGLVGLAAAAELCRRGFTVTVLEKSIPGAEASTAAAGILGPQLEHERDGPTLDLALAGTAATRRLVEAMGQDVDLVSVPAVKLACDAPATAALTARCAWQKRRGLRVELVEGHEARARLPGLAADVEAAAFFPDDGALDPVAYGQALHALVRARGCTILTGVTLAGLVTRNGRCTGARLESGAVCEADHVLVCAGAWSSRVPDVREASGLTLDDIHPVRGQVVELLGPPGLLQQVLYGPGGYCVPRRDGRVVCGSTMEHVGFDKATTEQGIAAIREMARRTLPALDALPIARTWSGLRPATRDGLPYLGETRLPGLWLSSGHFRNGVLLAAISAEVIAAQLLGEAAAVDVAPFSPRRHDRRAETPSKTLGSSA